MVIEGLNKILYEKWQTSQLSGNVVSDVDVINDAISAAL